MADSPQIDILMATFNGEKYISEQLDSIINQDYKHWHLLISDDCSCDRTIDIIKDYILRDNRIQIVSSTVKFGSAAANFMHLLTFSKAAYVAFADQDDLWMNNKLGIYLKKLQLLEGEKRVPSLVFSDLVVIDENRKILSNSYFEMIKINPRRVKLSQVVVQNIVTGCASMFNSALREIVCNVSFEAAPIIMHDWLLGVLASAVGNLSFIDAAPIQYRQHENNVVGASRYSIAKWVRNKKIRTRLSNTIVQARFIHENYSTFLPEYAMSVLTVYGNIASFSRFCRILVLVKYGIWKSNFSRICGQLFFTLMLKHGGNSNYFPPED